MPRQKANPENNVRGTTELLPQSRSTRIAGESAAQCPRAPATHDGTSAATTDIRSRGEIRKRGVLTKEEWNRASAYFRHYVASPPSSFVVAANEEAARAGRPPPLIYDAPRHKRAREGALAELELARGLLAKHAAVAVDASGSSEAGAAEEPLLSGPEDARLDPEDVRLPKTSERKRAEDSENTVWNSLELHRWHIKRQKTESSAVAGKESSAVAGGVLRSGGQVVGKGRARGLHVVGCMLLVELGEDEDEEESSQAITLHLASPAKGRYVCPDGD